MKAVERFGGNCDFLLRCPPVSERLREKKFLVIQYGTEVFFMFTALSFFSSNSFFCYRINLIWESFNENVIWISKLLQLSIPSVNTQKTFFESAQEVKVLNVSFGKRRCWNYTLHVNQRSTDAFLEMLLWTLCDIRGGNFTHNQQQTADGWDDIIRCFDTF